MIGTSAMGSNPAACTANDAPSDSGSVRAMIPTLPSRAARTSPRTSAVTPSLVPAPSSWARAVNLALRWSARSLSAAAASAWTFSRAARCSGVAFSSRLARGSAGFGASFCSSSAECARASSR